MFKKNAIALAILTSAPTLSIGASVSPGWEVYGERFYNGEPGSLITGMSQSFDVITGYTASEKDKKNYIAWKSVDGTWTKQEIVSSLIIKGVSNDGSIIYGSNVNHEGDYRAYTISRNGKENFSSQQELGTFYQKKDGSYIGNSEINATNEGGNIIIGKASSFEGITPSTDGTPTPSDHAFYAFRKADGTFEKLSEIAGFNSFRGERFSVANDITSSGDMIIGSSTLEGNTNVKHAFVTYRMRDNSGKLLNNYSQMFDLGTLCSIGKTCNSSANAINDSASFIIGESDTNSGSSHAFVAYQEKLFVHDKNSTIRWGMTDLGTLRKYNQGNSVAYAIAGFDLIVGQSDTDIGAKQAFYSMRIDSGDGKSFTALQNLGSLKKDGTGESAATHAIEYADDKSYGFIVSGYSDTDDGKKHAFIVKLRQNDGVMTPPGPPQVDMNPSPPPMIGDPDSIIDPDLEIETAPPV
ncbi:hypothetical protein A4I74_22685, partial [Salmonella enterica subsp. enterica serovar Richmond]|nr:hypothetical protein [Salmonella enterica subsp. enterica serovar Chester]EBS2737841.1 hypothetical protein [Salmonella enterica subsp. enterica serovar Richmond]EBW7940764.1 hypothetical protein [Salmonella enterica subsp. enterica serovar Richmond]ECF6834860.1 hypothetical protein [Salmonella enterica subsp. enterica]ECZ9565351.1 hypothetical protein [Salmonella enterica subsp. enterica serovar Richmond]